MIIEEVCNNIRQELSIIDESKLLKIFNKMFPEEFLGSINDNEDFKEEIIQSIIDQIEGDENISIKLYKKLFNEKISIETIEEYSEEENEQWL
jgi:hypothetical protein